MQKRSEPAALAALAFSITASTVEEANALLNLPFNDLLFRAQTVHRQHFDPNQVQVSTLLSIKTGACPEDCAYCPQSARYDTGLERERLMEVESSRCGWRNLWWLRRSWDTLRDS